MEEYDNNIRSFLWSTSIRLFPVLDKGNLGIFGGILELWDKLLGALIIDLWGILFLAGTLETGTLESGRFEI
mgnify:CR=1 FL=1